MSYQDPYAGQYGRYQPQQPQYGQPQYSQQQHYGQYADPAPEFNPYTTVEPPHQSYEQGAYDNYGGGYRDEPALDHEEYAPRRQGTQQSASYGVPPPLAAKSLDETSRFDAGEFTPSPRGPK